MKLGFSANYTLIMVFFACTSCKDDPELIAKREQQRTEIARLQGEVALAKERLGHMPKDKGAQLKMAEKQLQELALEANKLEAEVSEMQRRKADLEKEFAQYKEKYPLN